MHAVNSAIITPLFAWLSFQATFWLQSILWFKIESQKTDIQRFVVKVLLNVSFANLHLPYINSII